MHTGNNCINLGTIHGESSVGGFVNSPGDNSAVLVNCFSSGRIKGTYAGGLVGSHNWNNTAAQGTNCYYLTSDTVTNSVGKKGQNMNATALTKVTQEVIDAINIYIEEDPDGIGTTNWKKWTLDENGDPTFVK